MAIFDVRNGITQSIDEIWFADAEDYEYSIGVCISSKEVRDGDARIVNSNGTFVRIHSKTHARNLIKALGKAIELGWLKD